MQIGFWFEKNSNLYLRKMQISFDFKKDVDNMQIFEIKNRSQQ